ncbi:TetR/AcrR family transcriptional regulator [Nocardioides marmorisolisilvae]|uniref:TetR/AcrR family transcriptional regulator n=1 Tax=Nocardioides marmorisolisilvae TaxID=1542737 RepID=A0A3N0DYZ7_9ACTN|nr:TetR/AcrR family transcriptional regulator [Nocardioides marmorisolisilvae]RNL80817.1 TetR/AcrR family transcriptional regulator [Nocardioides marmorisolisilvae]
MTEAPRRRSERARVAILDATNELLHAHGLEQLSIEAVAARAGVGKQTIYRWWPNRAVLVADALLERDDLGPAAPADTGDVFADLGRWAGHLAASLGSPRGAATLRMLTAAATDDEETSRRLHEKFSGPLQEQANARLAAASDLPATAAQRRNAVDAIIGFMVFRVLAHQQLTRRGATEMARSVLRGLQAG